MWKNGRGVSFSSWSDWERCERTWGNVIASELWLTRGYCLCVLPLAKRLSIYLRLRLVCEMASCWRMREWCRDNKERHMVPLKRLLFFEGNAEAAGVGVAWNSLAICLSRRVSRDRTAVVRFLHANAAIKEN